MRLLVDARPLVERTGGVSRVGRALVAAYADAFPGDELICATTGTVAPAFPTELSSRANIRHVHLTFPNKLWSAATMVHATSFGRTMRRFVKTDATFFPNIGFTGPIGSSSVLLLHDLSFLIEPRWFTRKQRLWHGAIEAAQRIREATDLLAVSETTARDARRILDIPRERITVIPVGTTLERIEPSRVANLPRRYALAFGAEDPRKNAATAIESVRALRKQRGFEDVELVLAGRTNNRYEKDPWIHLIALPTDAELAALYQRASVFLYPSWYEGFGLPLHEAAASGIPRIASTAGSLPETAPPDTYFANPAKPHHWTEALSRALNSPRPQPIAGRSWHEAALVLHHALERSIEHGLPETSIRV